MWTRGGVMKFLCVGDLHYRASTPRARVDNYPMVLLGKIDQINDIADAHGCSYIFQPGDFFDSSTPPYSLVSAAIGKHKENGGWLAILGQHDQRYHSSDRKNTPLAVLEKAGALHLLDPKGLVLRQPRICIYGCSWGEEIPEIDYLDFCNILVMHRMVIDDQKLWAEQTEFTRARALLRRHKFDLIVTGDNHHFFTDSVPGLRWLVNCGSLMRSNIDQIKHKPTVVVYDSEEQTIVDVPLKVAPASKVFDMLSAKREKERNDSLESFVELVGKNKGAPDLDFLATLHKLSHAKGVGKGTASRVDEIVELSNGNS